MSTRAFYARVSNSAAVLGGASRVDGVMKAFVSLTFPTLAEHIKVLPNFVK